MGNASLQQEKVKFLVMHLDRRLMWAKHIKIRRNQLDIQAKQHYQHKTTTKKLLLYKAVLRPIWTNGILPQVPALKYSSVSDQRLPGLY
jgi:hypothetical protein